MTDFNFKPKISKSDFGWYGKNRLPHLDANGFTQFITFRLADSMPQKLLKQWRIELADDAKFRKMIEKYLDSGHGECVLRSSETAQIVKEALLYHSDTK